MTHRWNRWNWPVAVALAAALVMAGGCSKKAPKTITVQAPPGNKDVHIQVTENGFVPNRIEVKQGENTTLVFTRVTDRTCAKDVIINNNGAHLDLPLNQPVRIALGTVNTRIPFACGMKMVTGEVVAVR
ncbi:MAG: cupredoxin domain-containing protein [Bacteroidota bacterium]